MLIQFSVDNFRSIKDLVLFSMVSGTNNKINTFKAGKFSLLSSAVIYGANASGKSNVLSAFRFMKSMVLNFKKVFQSTDTLDYEPFRLSTETDTASSSFEIVFIHNSIKYRYGFEADKTTIYSEWLFADEKGKEAKLFFRDSEAIDIYVNPDKFKEGKGVKVLPNSLFIWKCDQEGGKISGSILEWFKKVNLLNGMKPSKYMAYTLDQMTDVNFRSQIKKLVAAADLDIQDVQIEENEVSSSEIEKLPFSNELKERLIAKNSLIKELGVKAIHNKYDANNKLVGPVKFDLSDDESEGTKKFFCLSAPFIDTLKKGEILIVDELDSSLHPKLTMALISLFNNKKVNKHNAQLIFATHDTNLLNQKLFHKSQIWFAEKDSFGATHLNSLIEYKNIRATDNIEKHYFQGKYGAIPYISDFPLGGY